MLILFGREESAERMLREWVLMVGRRIGIAEVKVVSDVMRRVT